MSKKNKHAKKESNFSKLIGYGIVACFLIFLASAAPYGGAGNGSK